MKAKWDSRMEGLEAPTTNEAALSFTLSVYSLGPWDWDWDGRWGREPTSLSPGP